MKKVLLSVAILTGLAVAGYADVASNGARLLTTDSGQKAVAVSPAAGTQILTEDNFAKRTWLVNRSSWTTFYISTFSALTSATGYPIPPGQTFTPDSPVDPWWGPLFAVVSGTGTAFNGIDSNIGIFRTK